MQAPAGIGRMDLAMIATARSALAAFAPAGRRSRLTILIYHRVRPQPDPLFPGETDSIRFDHELAVVSRLFNVIPLADAVGMLRKGTLPARPACITFDDGYADNAEVAVPLLRAHRLPATFFISTGFLNGGRMWNDTIIESVRRAEGDVLDLAPAGLGRWPIDTHDDKRRAISALIGQLKYLKPERRAEQCAAIQQLSNASLPDDLMLRTQQLREMLDAGMGIGAHTVNHPILARMSAEAAQREIADGRDALEAIAGSPITLFAYPNGKPGIDYGADHVSMVRALGFRAAVSTGWGAATMGADVFQLPRFTPWDRTPARMAVRFMRNLLAPVATAAQP